MNLYTVYAAGDARTFCLGSQEAQTVFERYHKDGKENIRVAYITTLTDVTQEFED